MKMMVMMKVMKMKIMMMVMMSYFWAKHQQTDRHLLIISDYFCFMCLCFLLDFFVLNLTLVIILIFHFCLSSQMRS